MFLRIAVVFFCIGTISAWDIDLKNLLAKRRSPPGPNYVCYQHPLDLVFILDASSSIWSQNFTKAKDFVNSFIEPYVIGSNKVRVAIETYAQRVYVEDVIHFNDFLTKESLKQSISGLVWHHGSRTETGDGIAYMREKIMPEARTGLRKICIVITDGKSQDSEKTALEAKRARDDRIDMFAIGVSSAVNRSELENIAGDPDRVIIVDTYSELEAIKDKLSYKTCREIPTTPAPPKDEDCGLNNPTDIYYVFDPAYLGIDQTAWVTQFITHTLTTKEFTYMRVGVISDSCPLDAGFNLNRYSSFGDIRERLISYENPRLPKLIGSLTSAYSVAKGGRPGVRRVAVIFLGNKIDRDALLGNIVAAREAGVELYFAGRGDDGLMASIARYGFNLAQTGPSAKRQALSFATKLCDESQVRMIQNIN
ncbi:von Willebrand factor [Patella vulgata]|uniref:von Willebrand factor n=1 Tax=Patella vulgata TaxID=6465 RepID=UPI00217FD213|nr:von Willebrand factor [Patella vulgata]